MCAPLPNSVFGDDHVGGLKLAVHLHHGYKQVLQMGMLCFRQLVDLPNLPPVVGTPGHTEGASGI